MEAMLPDYPAFKTELADILNRLFRRRLAQYQGFVGQVAKHRVFEGDKNFLLRSTGDSETTEFQDFSVARELSAKEVPKMTFEDILKELDAAAAEMGAKTARYFIEGLDKTLEAAGQVENAKGAKISGELLLRTLERIEMNFDESGNHKNLSLVIHPSNAEATAAALRELEDDPELRKRHRALIERKREAWRVREASRRLVG